MDLKQVFDKYGDEYLKFDLVRNKLHRRPDIHAFLLLDSLDPRERDMVSGAEHDQFWLDTDAEKVASIITEDQVRDLVRCGVIYDDDVDSFSMYA